MAQDLFATLKILAALAGSALLALLIAGFLEGRATGLKAFWTVLLLGGTVAALQIVDARWAPLVLAVAVGVGWWAFRAYRRR